MLALQTIGHIFGLSDAILGLTVFAVGNSLGDLVANATVAVSSKISPFLIRSLTSSFRSEWAFQCDAISRRLLSFLSLIFFHNVSVHGHRRLLRWTDA